jgi:hypothetical protein
VSHSFFSFIIISWESDLRHMARVEFIRPPELVC